MIVFSLWAIMSIVQDLNSSRMVFWISASVLTSTAAVASSRTRIFDLRNNALARLNSYLCPTLKFSPASETLTQLKWKCFLVSICNISFISIYCSWSKKVTTFQIEIGVKDLNLDNTKIWLDTFGTTFIFQFYIYTY